jgi:hypothetical protein
VWKRWIKRNFGGYYREMSEGGGIHSEKEEKV